MREQGVALCPTLAAAFTNYNEDALHSALEMKSPRECRANKALSASL